MSAVAVVLIVGAAVLIGILVAVFRLGTKAGGAFWYQQAQRSRLQAASADRRLHDLTRDAFVAMAEQAERHGTRHE